MQPTSNNANYFKNKSRDGRQWRTPHSALIRKYRAISLVLFAFGGVAPPPNTASICRRCAWPKTKNTSRSGSIFSNQSTRIPQPVRLPNNSRDAGAAYLEALVILPFLMIVWAGVFFMFHRYNAQQQMQLTARTCAWLWANQACEGSLPPQCNGVIRDAGPVDETGETDHTLRNSVDSEPVKQAAGNGDSFFDTLIGTILGNGFHANTKATVELPSTLGKGNRSVGAAEYLICNEKERTLMDVIKGAACVFKVPGAC